MVLITLVAVPVQIIPARVLMQVVLAVADIAQ
jgi:hypothetical protein